MNLDGLSKLGSAPWLYVVAAVLLLLLWEVAKKYVPKLVEWLAARIRDALAGTRLMHGRALRTYRQKVAARYARLPVLFMPGKGLDASTVYVPLQAVEEGETQTADAYERIKARDHAVVLGPPGAGKTMLLRHSMLFWAMDPTWRRGQRVPVLFELHRSGADGTSLEDHIVAQLREDGFPKADRFVTKALADGKLSLLFDGLDEVASAERDRVVQALRAFAARYSKCQIVVTCRTAIYRQQLVPEITTSFQVAEFDDRRVRKFLRQWPAMTEMTAVDQLLAALRDAPRIMQLARNPLLLTMIAYLYGSRPHLKLAHSQAEFYHEAADFLLDRLKDARNVFKGPVKKAVLKRLALAAHSASGDSSDRRTVSYVDVRTEIVAIGPNLGIEPADVDALLDEIVERSGLLLRIDGGGRYQFAHQSLQEYLAAVAHEQDRAGLLAKYRAAPDDWREVVKLWCGVVSADAGPLIDEMFQHDPVLAFECLANAQFVDEATADRITGHFQRVLLVPDKPLSSMITSAFGLVAADPRPRGRQVFEFLTAAAKDNQGRAYAALAATKLPEAAATLVPQICSPAARPALITMGDLAVPALAEVTRSAERDGRYAVDLLGAIGTPGAAVALAATLWTGEAWSRRAAWYLAALLTDPEVEAALAEIEAPDQASNCAWVGESFGPDSSSPVARIVARTAELCEQSTMLDIPVAVERIDPRLGIPLLVFGFDGSFLRVISDVRRRAVKSAELLRDWSYHVDSDAARTSPNPQYGSGADLSVFYQLGRADQEMRLNSATREIDKAVHIAKLVNVQQALYQLLDPRLRASLVARLVDVVMLRRQDWSQVRNRSVVYEFERSAPFLLLVILASGVEIAAAVGGAIMLFAGWPWGPAWTGWVLLVVSGVFVWGVVVELCTHRDAASLAFLLPGYSVWEQYEMMEIEWEWDSILLGASTLVGSLATTTLSLVVGFHYLGWPLIVPAAILLACAMIGLTWYGKARERQARNPFRGLLELDRSGRRGSSVIAA